MSHQPAKRLQEILPDLLGKKEGVWSSGNTIIGLPTGLGALDCLTGGFVEGELVVVAARPAVGKSALALNIALNAAVTVGVPVLFFSLEMGEEQIAQRVLACMAAVSYQHVARQPDFESNELPRVVSAVEALTPVNLSICADAALSLQDIQSVCEEQLSLYGALGLIVVDNLQALSITGECAVEHRASELTAIVQGLKALAQKYACPVLVTSHVSRAVDTSINKRPTLSDLSDSGSIENFADIVLLLYRDDYYNGEKSHAPGMAEIHVAKHRNGSAPVCIHACFVAPCMRFENLADKEMG